MKKVFLAVMFLIALSGMASAATLTWNAPTTNTDGSALTNLAGFKIHYGTATATYNQPTITITLAQAACTVATPPVCTYNALVPDGTWFFVVTAYNTANTESPYSNEVSKVVLTIPAACTGLH